MNKKQIITQRQISKSKYDQNSRIHVNCVRFGRGETFEHALTKFMLGWIVVSGGDVRIIYESKLTKSFVKATAEIFEESWRQWFFKGSEREFLTEAMTKDRKEIHDFVILDSGEVIEVVKSSDPPRKENVTRIEI